jgi:hypothetical protein
MGHLQLAASSIGKAKPSYLEGQANNDAKLYLYLPED